MPVLRASVRLLDFQLIFAGQLRKFLVGLGLIPERRRRDVVLERQVAVVDPPAERLNGYLQVFLKPHRVGNMPAVEIGRAHV